MLRGFTRFVSGGKHICLTVVFPSRASVSFDRFDRGLSDLKVFLQVEDELVQMSTSNQVLKVSFEGPTMYGGVSPTALKGATSCF